MAKAKNIRTEKVTIELGGKTRSISYDMNAFIELELKFGSVQAAMEALQQGTMKNLRIILWAGLIHEEAVFDEVTGEPVSYNITPYQVGSWVQPRQMPEISQKIVQAIGIGLPDDLEESPEAKKLLEEHGFTIKNGEVATIVPDEDEAKN